MTIMDLQVPQFWSNLLADFQGAFWMYSEILEETIWTDDLETLKFRVIGRRLFDQAYLRTSESQTMIV